MPADTHSFIVRIWFEQVDQDGNIVTWRGSIDHVGKDKRLYFHDFRGMTSYIREHTGINAGKPFPWARLFLNRVRHGLRQIRDRLTLKSTN